jgi:hypothetical protein
MVAVKVMTTGIKSAVCIVSRAECLLPLHVLCTCTDGSSVGDDTWQICRLQGQQAVCLLPLFVIRTCADGNSVGDDNWPHRAVFIASRPSAGGRSSSIAHALLAVA